MLIQSQPARVLFMIDFGVATPASPRWPASVFLMNGLALPALRPLPRYFWLCPS